MCIVFQCGKCRGETFWGSCLYTIGNIQFYQYKDIIRSIYTPGKWLLPPVGMCDCYRDATPGEISWFQSKSREWSKHRNPTRIGWHVSSICTVCESNRTTIGEREFLASVSLLHSPLHDRMLVRAYYEPGSIKYNNNYHCENCEPPITGQEMAWLMNLKNTATTAG